MDNKHRWSYHVGITVKIDGELYVVDIFYNEHSPGLSKQEDWIKTQYPKGSYYQHKNPNDKHLVGVDVFRDGTKRVVVESDMAYDIAIKRLNDIKE
ncbi:MAG: hypothetical protein K6E69_07680 [Treponema sp.]|uniref:hypothetical protein n=1 Tax=Treponema sp. TaxID=166 RepID=UPI00298D6731|nr:hypothetical protein [Treponema sp.]MCR5386986.1 hypothetical protein [Treponema sp.]